MKATRYGIKNLKYIMNNLENWISEGDDTYEYRENLFIAAGFLGFRLLQHQCGAAALTLVGEDVVDLIRVGLFQCSLFGAL